MSKDNMSKNHRLPGRRSAFKAALGGLAGAALVTAGSVVARAEDVSASATKKCATCRYWGGVRKISEDGGTVSADGKGWCNNPASPAYQRQTNPSQGAPTWTKWDALDG